MQKYQDGLKEKMRGSEFVFDSFDLLNYNFYKTSLNRGWIMYRFSWMAKK